MDRRSLLLRLAIVSTFPLTGCGGGQNPSNSRSRGSASLTIHWPEQTRLIPEAANSIALTLIQGAAVVERRVVSRPPAGQSSTEIIYPDLLAGSYTVQGDAYASTNGTGGILATGAASLAIVDDQTTQVALTLNSTIVRLELTADSTAFLSGESSALRVTAFDADNFVVLMTPGRVQWSVSTSAATLAQATGTANTATGQAPGHATITVTETESGKSASVQLTTLRLRDAAGLATTPCPIPYVNVRRQCVIPNIASTGRTRWRSPNLGAARKGGPITALDGSILLATEKIVGNEIQTALMAIDPANGATRWSIRLNTNRRIYSMCQAASGHILVALEETDFTGPGILYCIDPQTQIILWQKETRNLPPIAASNGLTFIADLQGVYGVEIASGNTVWFTPVLNDFSGRNLSYLSRYECLVYAQYADPIYCRALHIDTGKVVWSSRDVVAETAPVQHPDDLFLLEQGTTYEVISAKTGKTHFVYGPGTFSTDQPVARPCILPSGKTVNVVASQDQMRIKVYDLLNRREVVQYVLSQRYIVSVLGSSDEIAYMHSYVNDPNSGSGTVYYAGKFNLTTGNFLWNVYTGLFQPGETMCSDGQALYVTIDGGLVCVE
ncbi:MAG: PQQ-binding-like beta-propeller repeat protein [Armatimonas sp.]